MLLQPVESSFKVGQTRLSFARTQSGVSVVAVLGAGDDFASPASTLGLDSALFLQTKLCLDIRAA